MFIEQPISNEEVNELISLLEQRDKSIEEFDLAVSGMNRQNNNSWRVLKYIIYPSQAVSKFMNFIIIMDFIKFRNKII